MTIQQAFELALQHHQSGRLAEAEALYRQILAADPRHSDALHLLGVIAHHVGRHDIAIDLIGQAIALAPSLPYCHSNLGEACRAAGHLDDAIAAYRQAIFLKPDYAEAYSNLGNALRDKGQLDNATAAYRQAIALNPDYAQAHNNLGNALGENGQLDDAIVSLCRAIALNPDYAQARYNLGNTLVAKGQLDEAIIAYRQALALKPDIPEAHSNLGNALRDKGQLDEAITSYRHAIVLDPNYAEALSNLGTAFKDAGLLDDALDCYRRALALHPARADFHSNLLLTLNYHPDCDPKSIAEEHRRWNRLHAEPLRHFILPHPNDRNPDRRLRIGFLSPDLREHVVARFLLPLLENLDRNAFEIFAYAQVPVPDDMTLRLRSLTDAWRSLVGLSDSKAADLIRSDRIDILVDLAGHTAGNRLLVFARKPAPIQVTWLGYPNTTGLESMDYRLTDAFADPPGQTDSLCSETLLRLSPSAWCFLPNPAPDPAPRENGPITFASFNNFAKVNPSTLALWARILLSVPHSRLLLKSLGLSSPSVQDNLRLELQSLGVDPHRLDLRSIEFPDYRDHLALYHHADIALDTFPYHGTTTTCEALWMGIPVISLAGSSHVSRVGLSLLCNVGLPELVAHSPDEYVRLASSLATDLPRLALLRSSLRSLMLASPLMDAPRFALSVEAAFRQMWRSWCLKQG